MPRLDPKIVRQIVERLRTIPVELPKDFDFESLLMSRLRAQKLKKLGSNTYDFGGSEYPIAPRVKVVDWAKPQWEEMDGYAPGQEGKWLRRNLEKHYTRLPPQDTSVVGSLLWNLDDPTKAMHSVLDATKPGGDIFVHDDPGNMIKLLAEARAKNMDMEVKEWELARDPQSRKEGYKNDVVSAWLKRLSAVAPLSGYQQFRNRYVEE